MKRVVALVDHTFEDLELMYPVLRMGEASIEVLVAGEKKDEVCVAKHGYPCKSQISYHEIHAKDFDGILIPGGFAPDRLRSVLNILKVVQEMDRDKKMIAFICHGGWVPISAGILRGKRVTGTRAIKDDLENAGAIWHDEPVVIDGHLISSRSPADLPFFGKAMVQALK